MHTQTTRIPLGSHSMLFCFAGLAISIILPCMSSESLLLLNAELTLLQPTTPSLAKGGAQKGQTAQERGLQNLQDTLSKTTLTDSDTVVTIEEIKEIDEIATRYSFEAIKNGIKSYTITSAIVKNYFTYILQDMSRLDAMVSHLQRLYREAFNLNAKPDEAAAQLYTAIEIIEPLLPIEDTVDEEQLVTKLTAEGICINDVNYYIQALLVFPSELWILILNEIDPTEKLSKLITEKSKRPDYQDNFSDPVAILLESIESKTSPNATLEEDYDD